MADISAGVRLAPAARARIAAAAAGNPLFLEQMLAMLAEGNDEVSEIAVPPAIQALLAARLDRLEPDERRVLACASIEGEVFHVGGVTHLAEPETPETATSALMSLVHKELIHPAPPDLTGDEGFRFRHALIRDAAYEGLSKESRSQLHARYATWLEQTAGEQAAEFEEFLAYHLEQAFLYRSELGLVDSETREIGDRAAQRLASAGRRAALRVDAPAAANLLNRAIALYPEAAPERIALLPDLGEALVGCGELARADQVLAQAINEARAATLQSPELHAEVVYLGLQVISLLMMDWQRFERGSSSSCRALKNSGTTPCLPEPEGLRERSTSPIAVRHLRSRH